ncbi:MAG: LysR family transcriptional regulator, partial [Pseudomonadota bacterium]
MIDFDLNLLNVLVALDQTRHAGRAAEALEMSQSGFSTALGRLRKRTGDELFVRTGAGMQPTARALVMVETARTVLQQVQQNVLGMTQFQPALSQVSFRLSMSDVAEAVFMPSLIEHLARHAPGASIHVASPSLKPLAERLAGGEVDLAIGHFPDLARDTYYRQPLYSQTYACVVRSGHPVLATGMTRAAYRSLGHAVVTTAARSSALLENALERHRMRRRVVLSSPHHLSLPGTIARSDLVATVPLGAAIEFARSGTLVVCALPFAPPVFTSCQHWHLRTHNDPAYQWLRAQIKILFDPANDP